MAAARVVVRRVAWSRSLGVERAWTSTRRDRLIPLLLFASALLLYIPRLETPSRYLFDEIIHAYTAGQYVNGNPDAYLWDAPCSVGKNDEKCVASNPSAVKGSRVGKYEWVHPPLGRHLIAAGIVLFGDDPFGWRIASVIAGAIGIVLAYRLGLVLTSRMSIAILTAGLLLMDGLYFVESRTAVIDIYGTVFTMAALLSFAGYLAAPPERARWPLIQTGMFMGLGIATKWNAAYPSAVMAFVALWRLSQLWRETRLESARPTAWMGLREHVIGVPVGLVAIPIVEYVASYVPFFLAGHSPAMFLSLQRHMLDFQVHFTGTFDYSSRWWEWPLALRPVWHGATNYADGRVANTYANGNPFLYWAFLPALFWVGLRWWRSRNSALVVLLIGFFGQWLPWVLVSRATFAYHFLPAVPFGCLAVATAVADLYRGNTAGRRTLAIGYVVLVAAAFAFFYPIYSFLPMSERALELRLWLPSWR